MIEQVWFADAHSDVGGWHQEAGLSDVALEWMLRKADAQGLLLKPGWRSKLNPDPLDDLHESWTGFWRLFPWWWRLAYRPIPKGTLIHKRGDAIT